MNVSISPIHQPASLADLAYERLKEIVISSKINPAAKLEERALAKQLGISRTPLREAIHRLVCEGFLRVEPRKGVFLNQPTKEEAIEILYVRAALEAMAARLAVRYITVEDITHLRSIFRPFTADSVDALVDEFAIANVEFHERSMELSRCKRLIELASNIRDQMRLVRIYTMRSGGRARNSYLEHLAIIDALESRNADLSANRMREHILGLAQHVERSYTQFPLEMNIT